MTLKELREQRKSKVAEMRTISDALAKENRGYTEEEATKFDTLAGEVEGIDANIARQTKLESLEQRGREVPDSGGIGRGDIDPANGETPERQAERSERRANEITEEDRAMALAAWISRGSPDGGDIDDRHMEACRKVGLNPDARQIRFSLHDTRGFKNLRSTAPEKRTLSAVNGSKGGFLVPQEMVNQLEINMLAFGGMMEAADVIRTNSGGEMSWPTMDDTSNTGRQVGESVAVNSDNDPSTSSQTWSDYKFTSDEIKVPYELLEDSAFDLASVIGQLLGERLGRILNTKFTTGNGAGTPQGVLTGITTGHTAASATAITWTEINKLIHSIDSSHRKFPCAFMFSDGIQQLLEDMLDGEGRPLWLPGPNGTAPKTLRGYPYFINHDMNSAPTTGQPSMIFGRLDYYKVRQVNDVRFYRLTERHRENDQDAFLAFIRADGKLLNPGTAPVKALVQA